MLPPPFKFLMYGVEGVGKSTMRTAMTDKGKIIPNYAPTKTVMYDTGRYMGQPIRILDFSGSLQGEKFLLGDVKHFENVKGFCFFFNAENIYRQKDYVQLEKMLKMLMIHSRYAVGHIFLHRTDKIEEGKEDEMWKTLIKNVRKHREEVCPDWVTFYFHTTSIYRPSTIPNAWQRICESIIKVPHNWEDTLTRIGRKMEFIQVVVLDRTQPFIVSNFVIKESKAVLDEDGCKKKANTWFQLGELDEDDLNVGSRTLTFRKYHHHTTFIGIKERTTETVEELDLAKIQKQWLVLNCPFRLNENWRVTDYSTTNSEPTMFIMPKDWAEKFEIIGEVCSMAQVLVFDEIMWTLVHEKVIEEDGAFKVEEWEHHVRGWRQSLENREVETDGRRVFIQKVVSGTVLIMITKDASVTPFLVQVNLSIAKKLFEGKLQLRLK